MIWIPVSIATILFITTLILFSLPQWGKSPNGERKKRLIQSPQFKGKQFQNFSPTPNFTEGYTVGKVMMDFFFKKVPHKNPTQEISVIKTDLKKKYSLPHLTWFGHSSYLFQIDNKNILVDPVFSRHASPFSFTVQAFNASYNYGVDDMPEIDILLITHDHYDHLDYKTIKKILPKVKQVITSLGVGAHLEKWGYDPAIIHELDWWEEVNVFDHFKFTATPSRHFSGRGLKRNLTLWSSFVLETKDKTIFLGGDSGYDTHFKMIGERWKSFDLAILECGQYNLAWHYIHMLPNETVRAAQDLQAKIFMPVHWGKFALSLHSWKESIETVIKEAEKENVPLLSPQIGETISIQEPMVIKWWEHIQ